MTTAEDHYNKIVEEQNKDQNFSAKRIALVAMETYSSDLIEEAADIAFDYILHNMGAVEARKVQRSILGLIK